MGVVLCVENLMLEIIADGIVQPNEREELHYWNDSQFSVSTVITTGLLHWHALDSQPCIIYHYVPINKLLHELHVSELATAGLNLAITDNESKP
jgi:hypothetical protein